MRFALVVLFLLALHIALRPSPSPDSAPPLAQDTISQPQTVADAQEPPAADPNAPVASDTANVPPTEAADAALAEQQPAIRSGETEKPSEQRTSQRTALNPADIEAETQKELMRLACLNGRPEKGWGERSRTALRRFATRAKPKDANGPSEELLRIMRDYPDKYCKLCAPGQPSCKIGPAPQKKSELRAPPVARVKPAPEAAYLPPWMLQDDGRVVTAQDGPPKTPAPNAPASKAPDAVAKVREEVRTAIVAHAPPAAMPSVSAKPRRPAKRLVKRPRPSTFRRRTRDFSLPNLPGWPRAY